MYNEELKKLFISGYTNSEGTKRTVEGLFNLLAPYEQEVNRDVCTWNSEELSNVLGSVCGISTKTHASSISVLKGYAKWCLSTGVHEACDSILHINYNDVGVERIRCTMVANPTQLQRYLNTMFEPEQEETIDNVYRCYFWLAFSGIREEDIFLIKKENLDFDNLIINHGYVSIDMYRESVSAFKNATFLNSFLYKHPNYKSPIRRDRVSGDNIMRGIKANMNVISLRQICNRQNKKLIDECKLSIKLGYQRVYKSGIFYRMYESERAGMIVDFANIVADYIEGREYADTTTDKKYLQRQLEKEYNRDYKRWKKAFAV